MTPERTEKLINVLSKRQANLTVVMENVQDPHNVSAVLRTCDAVGIQDVYILTTKIPRHKKFGYKSSSSALKWLTIHEYDDLEACMQAVRKNFTKVLTTHLSSDAVQLYDIDFTESVALVFGNEHSGVTEECRALADGNFIIPQMGIIQSLNISVACAVSIYEAMRQKMQAGHYDHASLPKEQMDGLLTQWGVEELTPETYVPYKPKRK
jgi:tRNA (guanosine-2'-O-)-methyltransferase